jgi:methyl-accepting chemotaxis protein
LELLRKTNRPLRSNSFQPFKIAFKMPMTQLSCVRSEAAAQVSPALVGRGRNSIIMSLARNIPVARKMALSFGLVCALCLGLGAYSFFTFGSIVARCGTVSQISFPGGVQVAKIQLAIDLARRSDLALLLCQTPDCTGHNTAQRRQALEDYQAGVKAYEPLIGYPGERELYQRFTIAFNKYLDFSNRANELRLAGKIGEALDTVLADAAINSVNDAVDAATADFDLNVRFG